MDATICLVNRERIAHHVATLAVNTDLDTASALESDLMHDDRFFGHTNPHGQTPRQQVLASGYGKGASDVATAQCIAWGSGREATPAAIVKAWMSSRSHADLLLSGAYREIGLGVGLGSPKGSSSGAIYTADLASKHLDK